MREMVFRERHEKVAHATLFAKLISQMFNMDADRAFGHLLADYAGEVFQETYDVELLQRKAVALKEARRRIGKRKRDAQHHMTQLDRLGEYYDQVLGADLLPLKKPPTGTGKPATIPPVGTPPSPVKR